MASAALVSRNKTAGAEPQRASVRRAAESGAPAGVPLFLQRAPVQAKEAPRGVNRVEAEEEEEEEEKDWAPRASVQAKCACGAGLSEERDAPVQLKADSAGAGLCGACVTKQGARRRGVGSRDIRALAQEGVASASAPLPHIDRIQASFGRHDVTKARAQVGGAAAHAAARMGALAYTVGDRIAFRSMPDVKLAAHEAAHVVQQRNGAKLAGGVGRPGDPYERHADEVAEVVARGASAEPLLDRLAFHGARESMSVPVPEQDTEAALGDRPTREQPPDPPGRAQVEETPAAVDGGSEAEGRSADTDGAAVAARGGTSAPVAHVDMAARSEPAATAGDGPADQASAGTPGPLENAAFQGSDVSPPSGAVRTRPRDMPRSRRR